MHRAATMVPVRTITSTSLPGVGVRYDLALESGARVGVLAHRTGRREVFVYGARDPDAVAAELVLTPEEGKVLADLLGGTQLIESLSRLQHQIEGLAIDWIEVPPTSRFVDRTIADAEVRSRTGVSIVAVIRDDEAHPAPGPDFRFSSGDTAVVVGTPEGIATATSLLTT
jgi:TrkA domain protein